MLILDKHWSLLRTRLGCIWASGKQRCQTCTSRAALVCIITLNYGVLIMHIEVVSLPSISEDQSINIKGTRTLTHIAR